MGKWRPKLAAGSELGGPGWLVWEINRWEKAEQPQLGQGLAAWVCALDMFVPLLPQRRP